MFFVPVGDFKEVTFLKVLFLGYTFAKMKEFFKSKHFNPLLLIAFAFVSTAIILQSQGRIWWCANDSFTPWSSDIWSRHNSQHLFDPYTFTHILHGVVYFWLITLIFKKMPLMWQFMLAIFIGCGWELLENSKIIIERYRAETISLDYTGDSIANSLADIFSCGFGFYLTYKLMFWRSLVFFFATEFLLLVWIRDSLIVNVIMLVFPIKAIKDWQIGS
jgi:Protein of unknown function (DUF2585)